MFAMQEAVASVEALNWLLFIILRGIKQVSVIPSFDVTVHVAILTYSLRLPRSLLQCMSSELPSLHESKVLVQ